MNNNDLGRRDASNFNNTASDTQTPTGSSYTPPSVPRASTFSATLFAAILYFASFFAPLIIKLALIGGASAFLAKGLSVKSSVLALISPIPAIVLALSSSDLLSAFLVITGALCGIAMYLSLKFGGSKITAVIASSTIVIVAVLIFFTIFLISQYGSFSIDSLTELFNDVTKAYENYLAEYRAALVEAIEMLPESAKATYEQFLKMFDEQNSDAAAYINAVYQISPAILITAANAFSYFAALIYFFLVKENTGHSVFATREKAFLSVSSIGVLIFGFGFLLVLFSGYSSTVGMIGLNTVLIYTPALFIIGIKSVLDPETRKRNMFMLIAAVVLLFFNFILFIVLIASIGANTILSNALLKHLKANFDENGKPKD